MSDLYGQINLTKLGEIVRNNPELVKEVTFKDGRKEKMININVYEKEKDQWGNTAYLKVACKPENRKMDKSAYYLCDLKEAPNPNANHTGGTAYKKREDYVPEQKKSDDLPF